MKLKLQNWIKFSTKLEGVTFNLDDQKFNVYVYVYIYINVYEIFIKKKMVLFFFWYVEFQPIASIPWRFFLGKNAKLTLQLSTFVISVL